MGLWMSDRLLSYWGKRSLSAPGNTWERVINIFPCCVALRLLCCFWGGGGGRPELCWEDLYFYFPKNCFDCNVLFIHFSFTGKASEKREDRRDKLWWVCAFCFQYFLSFFHSFFRFKCSHLRSLVHWFSLGFNFLIWGIEAGGGGGGAKVEYQIERKWERSK